MKKRSVILMLGAFTLSLASCEKSCHECHYDGPGGAEVELGEKCDDELEELENSGIAVDGTTYEVHCHEH